MKTKIISQLIAIIAFLIGVMVMFGWYMDNTLLTSISPNWIRMKFATALCFCLSGIVVFLLTTKEKEKKILKQTILAIAPVLIILIMGILFLGSIFGFQSGLENIAFVDKHEIATPIFQGKPALPTMISFMLIAVIGLLYNFDRVSKKVFYIIGSIVCILGTIGVIGYVLKNPYLTYEIPGVSNAIAIHTTILFSLLGLSLILTGKDWNNLS